MRCKKCGELGKRADSCGKTHNVTAAIAPVDIEPPPITSRRDRFAAIEAAARSRSAAGLER